MKLMPQSPLGNGELRRVRPIQTINTIGPEYALLQQWLRAAILADLVSSCHHSSVTV